MMKYLPVLLCLVFLAGCGEETGADPKESSAERATELTQKAADLNKEKKTLMETDRLFAKASEDKGFAGAFAQFTADEARIFQNKLMPIVGKEAIVKFLTENVKGTITWEPYFVEMSASGDLGYTLGKSQSLRTSASGKKTVSYGHYVTIWKKQSDGSWKVVFDTGIETPK
jgi:ketosteroid isomerase-like protein